MTLERRDGRRKFPLSSDRGEQLRLGAVRVQLRQASKAICTDECGAQCCRAPGHFRCDEDELEVLREEAVRLGVRVRVVRLADKWAVDFKNNDGACPFLDRDTSLCRVYAARPQACRDFPTKYEERCVLFRHDT